FYAVMGAVLGISVDRMGALLMLLLAAVCFARAGTYWTTIVRTAVLPLACGASFALIQVFVYGESFRDTEAVKAFIIWMAQLFVVHYLTMSRGFMHRAAVAIFLIGLSTLPYMQTFHADASRTALEHSIAISNPNDLGAWFGYTSGMFEHSTELYEKRAFLETGRFLVWPLALGRFISSPFIGVGLKNIATYIPSVQTSVTPHNGVLLLALSSGVVPLGFFL